MESRWTDRGAREAVDRWGAAHGECLASRLYTARLIGQDTSLVLHGGGNVSVKQDVRTLLGDDVEAVLVKASGSDLATVEPEHVPALDLAELRRFRRRKTLSDEQMFEAFRLHQVRADAPVPSIETMLHAFLPHRFVDHSHADAILTVTNQPEGMTLAQQAGGDRVAVLPYIRPGFELAKAVADACDADPALEGIVLAHHGLVTFGDDARTSYERHIAIVDRFEQFIEGHTRGQSLTAMVVAAESADALAVRIAPILRGMLARPTGNEDTPFARPVMEWRATEAILRFVNSKEGAEIAASGPLTGDHLIRTKPWPMFVAGPDFSSDAALRAQLRTALAEYAARYEAYIAGHGGTKEGIDPMPRVVLMPAAGMFCWGPTKRDACIAADITEHTLSVKIKVHLMGKYESLQTAHLYEMEYRPCQIRKLGGKRQRLLKGQVVVISGGAGAIGAAVAEACAQAGACVVVADLDEPRAAGVADSICRKSGAAIASSVAMDVTDEASVHAGFETAARAYGGVDVVVANAGIAHVGAIDQLDAAEFRRVMEVNAIGYFLLVREGIRMLKIQGLGGNVIINASKNVFAPGKDFAAYSASKTAGHQLGKVAAIELAEHGIRVNMINADAVFGDEEHPSGLWAHVGPARAKSRDMDVAELPEYYRKRNLLHARVTGRHVANAVLFFASNQTPTTGATLPVDGGIVEAFPR